MTVSNPQGGTMRYVTEATALGPAINEIPQRLRANFPDIKDEMFWELYEKCKNYSMLHITGFLNLYGSVQYLKANKIVGDFVECGCFLGGASIFLSLLRDALDLHDKELWVFDSFEGFPQDQTDALVGSGEAMPSVRYDNFREVVRENFEAANPGCRNVHFVEGFVEDTIPGSAVRAISLLRLDTDFYTSTLAELEGLYDRLVRGGVLIVDDYGIFDGSRRATDEFFSRLQSPPLLHRIDMSVWAGVKP